MVLPVWLLGAFFLQYALEAWVRPPLPEEGREAIPWFLGLLAGFLLVFELAALLRFLYRGRKRKPLPLMGLYLVLPALPLLFHGLALQVGGWSGFVRFRVQPEGFFLEQCFMLLPFFGFEILSVLGTVRVHGQITDVTNRVKATWLFAPLLLLFFLLQDLLSLHPVSRAALFEIPPVFLLSVVLGALFLGFLFPLWFTWLLSMKRLPDPDLEPALREIAGRAGIRPGRLRMLPTENRMLNAGVVGPFPWTRTTFFTDLMLSVFTPQQILGVFAHEAAHVERNHFPRLLLFLALPPILLLLALEGPLSSLAGAEGELSVFWLSGCLLLMVPLLRKKSHLFEHEADLFGARLLGSYDDYLRMMESVLVPTLKGHGRPGLRHPDMRRRIAFLCRAVEDPGVLEHWFRRGRRLMAASAFLLGAGTVLLAPGLWKETRLGLPSFHLSTGRPRTALRSLSSFRPEAWQRELWEQYLDEATRASLILHEGEAEGREALPLLRGRALGRARRALRKAWSSFPGSALGVESPAELYGHFEEALGWIRLASRFGRRDRGLSALGAYLEASLERDEEGKAYAEALLRFLPAPAKLEESVGKLLERG